MPLYKGDDNPTDQLKCENSVAIIGCQYHIVIEETVLNWRYSLISFNDQTKIYWMSQFKNYFQLSVTKYE